MSSSVQPCRFPPFPRRNTAWVTRPETAMTMTVEPTVMIRYFSQEGAMIPQESMIPTAAGMNITGIISTRKRAVSLTEDRGTSLVFNRINSIRMP